MKESEVLCAFDICISMHDANLCMQTTWMNLSSQKEKDERAEEVSGQAKFIKLKTISKLPDSF